MAKAPPVKWTRDHFLIALNLYCKLPFGQLHKGNRIIFESAAKMGRTPNSLAMKLCNFASLDPVQRAHGIRGLPGATKQDRAMWNEFHEHLATLAPESEQLVHDLFTKDQNEKLICWCQTKSNWSLLLGRLRRRQPSKFDVGSNFSDKSF